MRFLCDAMLGGLAKWLRAAGYDAYYAREGTDVSDRSLTAKALAERRVLLTSDGGFLERKPVRDGSVGFLRVPHLPLARAIESRAAATRPPFVSTSLARCAFGWSSRPRPAR